MKKIRLLILSIILVFTFSVQFSVFATTLPYENYTFSESDSKVIHGPQAYIPSTIIYGNDWVEGALKSPTDLDVDSNGNIYILDNGNNRVVCLNNKLDLKSVFSCAKSDENGNEIFLNNAEGITVTQDKIYICDTDNKRILIYNKTDGSFLKTVNAPESSLLGEDFIFQPTKVAVDNKENLYVVSNGTFEGIINMKDSGEFDNFFASNSVTASAWELFWRRFSTQVLNLITKVFSL